MVFIRGWKQVINLALEMYSSLGKCKWKFVDNDTI